MCGIVGFAGRRPIDDASLGAMCDTMSHRGPDDRGLWFSPDRSVGFGHRRLAIIDLSPGGHQPMADASGRLHITFNGEIYNFMELRSELKALGHSFRTASDTEVIVEAYREWGEESVRRLVGMFAFGLYDENERCLLVARDRAGEKPLFVWEHDGRLVFTSELKALFALPEFPRRLNLNALEHYLAFAYVPQDLCLLEGVRKLLPGCMLRFEVDRGSVRMRRYWDLPRFEPDENSLAADELADELDTLLLGAVRRQLIADVPIGIMLSGGVDSSLVTAIAARAASRPVKTFTITFPGHSDCDEAPFARLVASHFGTEHTELPAEPASVALLPELARQYDEPIGDSSMVPTFLVSRLIRQHAKVALGGDGGDELFGGYSQYLWSTRLGRLQQLVPSALRAAVSRGARLLPPGTRGRNYLIALGSERFGSLARLGLIFDREWRDQLLTQRQDGHPTPDELRLALTDGASSMLQAAERLDFRSYMVDDILVKVDRASMLASLEVRAPFLDPFVIEFSFRRLPDHLKVSLTDRKILLRRLAARLLPRSLDLERKQGFALPLGSWFAGDWGSFMRGVLAEAPPEVFRPSAIRSLLTGQERRGNQIHRLFALVMFELWRREYSIAV